MQQNEKPCNKEIKWLSHLKPFNPSSRSNQDQRVPCLIVFNFYSMKNVKGCAFHNKYNIWCRYKS